MRRSIRLTGRSQLSQSAFDFQMADLPGKLVGTLTIVKPQELSHFPPESEIRVKLTENKLVQILKFGTVGRPVSAAEVGEYSFRAPSCQVRVVNRSRDRPGLLLGSTSNWTYQSGGQPDGILFFQPADIKPRLWKLVFPNDSPPILYVDERIPNARLWAASDPIFTASVLPTVITEIMRHILAMDIDVEDGWAADWLTWANTLMPGSKPPFVAPDDEKEAWVNQLVDAFLLKHDLAANVFKLLDAQS